jgi:hypothetical protein
MDGGSGSGRRKTPLDYIMHSVAAENEADAGAGRLRPSTTGETGGGVRRRTRTRIQTDADKIQQQLYKEKHEERIRKEDENWKSQLRFQKSMKHTLAERKNLRNMTIGQVSFV